MNPDWPYKTQSYSHTSDDDEITRFLDAPGKDRRSCVARPMTPHTDITAYLERAGCLAYTYVCYLQPPETPVNENPPLTLIAFTTRTVKYADVDITDSGVVPRNAPEQPEDIKERVRRWMQLDHESHDPHVSTTANRIFYMGAAEVYSDGIGICSDDAIANLFAQVAEISGKEPRELEFSIVYDEDDMAYLTAVERSIREELEYVQERAKELAENGRAPPTQPEGGQTPPWYD